MTSRSLDPQKRPQQPPRERTAGTRPRWQRWLWFLAGLIVTLGGLEVVARQLGPRATVRVVLEQHRVALDDRGDRVATMVVGDSSVGAAVDPALVAAVTDTETYNLWLPNASATMTASLLTDFAGISPGIDTVVVGLTARMFNETVRADRDLLLARVSNSLPWEARADPGLYTDAEQWASERLALVRHRADLRRPSDWIVNLRSDSELELTDEGQVTFFSGRSVDDVRPDYESGERTALSEYRVSAIELDRLLALIDRLQSDGIEVVVLMLPTFDALYDGFFPNGAADREGFRAALAARLEERAIQVVDTTDLGERGALFADGNHMNREGATVLSERLAAELGG